MPRYIDADAVMRLIPREEIVARMAIANAPTADVAEVPRWIPVTERLPETANFYICTMKDNLVKTRWYSTFHGFESQDDVIAWMPLPKPWKGDSDGGSMPV